MRTHEHDVLILNMPVPTLELLLYCLAAYLIGSISTAIITCTIMGIEDPRKTGSNNPGATNVLRHGGKKAAVITLLGDMLKGLIPVLICKQLTSDELTIALVGAAALLGHIAPLYYGFKGGKGVATFFGALLGFHWITGLLALAIWLFIAVGLKISSLSALVSVTASPIILWLFTGSAPMALVLAAMSLLVIIRHRSNIQRLLHGQESRINGNS
jgi:glycerol-3-phosphate acyltransferase PlsY